MIITVSPNTALDRTRIVNGFQAGKQSRSTLEFIQPGGSGTHAAYVIQELGGTTMSIGPCGGHVGGYWKDEARKQGLRVDMVEIPGETRESICLVDLDLGTVVESVVAGPTVPPETKDRLLERVEHYLPEAELIIVSGSVPPGIPAVIYAELIELARKHAVRTLADIHSEPLKIAIEHRPWLIKPNLAEFDDLLGFKTKDLAERILESRKLSDEYGTIVALSMAGDGLLLTDADQQTLLTAPAVEIHLPGGKGKNFTGCGDALVGGLAFEYCRSKDLVAAAKLGLAAAHFNLSTFGTPEINAAQVFTLASQVKVQKLNG